MPTASDRAIIPVTKTAEILSQNGLADTVDCAGTILIHPTYKLTLENNNDNIAATPDNSEIDGEIILEYDNVNVHGGSLAFTTADHVVDGDGRIKGGNADVCFIEIDGGRKLTNQLANTGQGIRGSLTIVATGEDPPATTFRNEGLVEVSELKSSNIVLSANIDLEDIGGAKWAVNACNAKLIFQNEALTLSGDFTVLTTFNPQGGRDFQFDQTVWTCGTYTRETGGLVDRDLHCVCLRGL
ncbi:MAG: hypothetical protein ACKVW3_06405 [Phycisphaerales bacterium]